MPSVVERVASEEGVPKWWMEAVIVEYLECRLFAGTNEIWEFDFDRIPEDVIRRSIQEHSVVIHGTLFHNIHETTWRSRLLGRMVSAVPIPIALEGGDSIPEGPVSPYHFCFLGNPMDVWDPKLSFSRYFQVLHNGQLWQWRIAEFVSVEGRNYGKWVSDDIDLEPLDQIHPRLAQLRNLPIRPGNPGHATFEQRVREFYDWLEDLRTPIRQRLYDVHLMKRGSYKGPSKVVTDPPPLLSQFEDFTVRNGEILTRFHAEPIFFQSLVHHSRNASSLSSSSDANARLHEIYLERVQAVVGAAACLEAFINSVGEETIPNWKLYERLQPQAKWHLCLTVHGQDGRFDSSREPYQTFHKIIELRNRWLHYGRTFERTRHTTTSTISWIEAKMSGEFIEALPQRITTLIEELCEAIAYPVPAWLKSAPGWEV